MTNNKMFLDIHVIQTLPPSNINRDDTGSPKTALYGGSRRARVSSQSWKKAIREYFKEEAKNKKLGIRTMKLAQSIAFEIRNIDLSISEEDSLDMAREIVLKTGLKLDNKDKTGSLFFINSNHIKALANAAINGIDDKKRLEEIITTTPAIDIALFGRMVAENPVLNEDASCQVSHAISTHPIVQEFDFFTATDDLDTEESQGASMLGTVEFNSPTLYRYSNIALHSLMNQLNDKEDVIDAVELFTEGFIKSLPTGKVTTFANQTLPQAILLTIREDRPQNLISAFEVPIKSTEGYVDKSIEALLEEYEITNKFYKEPVFESFMSTRKISLNENSDKGNLDQLLKDLKNTLEQRL